MKNEKSHSNLRTTDVVSKARCSLERGSERLARETTTDVIVRIYVHNLY